MYTSIFFVVHERVCNILEYEFVDEKINPAKPIITGLPFCD